MKICCACGVKKPIEDYPPSKGVKNGHARCRPCKQLYDREYYKNNIDRGAQRNKQKYAYIRAKKVKKLILEYLKTHPCVDCGESDPVVLEFDHIDPTTKKYSIGNMRGQSIETTFEEIAKCEVRCANCHRRKTAKINNYYRQIWV